MPKFSTLSSIVVAFFCLVASAQAWGHGSLDEGESGSHGMAVHAPSLAPCFGPIVEPNGFGRELEFGPIVEPNGFGRAVEFGPIVEPNGFGRAVEFGPIVEPNGLKPSSHPWASTLCFGPVVEPNGLDGTGHGPALPSFGPVVEPNG